jgi:hypothetical protein
MDLRTEGCTFTRVAFFVCGRVILCLWAFSASVGFILRPRLNGVLMALEGGGSGKVRVSDPGAKWAKNGRWEDRWRDKVEGQF